MSVTHPSDAGGPNLASVILREPPIITDERHSSTTT